ncbi:GNAT family N-acetyltransferase [uncultured Ferrimonas sp.]|uniref:GNAT family N-acetyltransferase n=1 Tax=uncultured Ferrimonas sp. TaxID=432640 RepID=UPI00262163FE|nr:GNAT family N-acetyltransferase [uncultured Ferrimonas sp.]
MSLSTLFTSPRLEVSQVTLPLTTTEHQQLIDAAITLLTPAVVAPLPPYFAAVTDQASAAIWLDRMLADSTLLLVSSQQQAIGFCFAFAEPEQVHIGYLLGQAYWGQGLATELLRHWIDWAQHHSYWQRLIGGVGRDNPASAAVLRKLGFELGQQQGDTDFYQLILSR